MRYGIFVLIIFFGVTILGCSGTGDITQPADVRIAEGDSSNVLCGLYQFMGYPDERRLEIIPLRQAALHLNAIPMLEPNPPMELNVGIEGGIDMDSHSVRCKIKLTHPLTGLDKFPGFDVCGILIGQGSETPYYDTELVLPGGNEVHLLNPDGMTRWWNPAEFPHTQGSITAYNDGFLGLPNAIGNFTATLNGYKYFADGLGPYDEPSMLPIEARGVFSPGATNVRYYEIEFGSGNFVFNYAVDACWAKPIGPSPWTIPDDFPPYANRPEAWNIVVNTITNELWNDGSSNGGTLELEIKVYDHFAPDQNNVRIESPGNLTTQLQTTAVEIQNGYAVYSFNWADATPAEYSIDLFITVENSALNYGGLLPGKYISTYFLESMEVGNYGPGIDADLILNAVRNYYAPPGPGYPQTWITGIELDWSDLPDAAEYAVYRSPLWADPYEWTCIGTTVPATTEFTNTTDDDYPIDWDADYIYEVRPRSIPANPSSEGGATERAMVVMETNNDDGGTDPLNPQWKSVYGAGGSFQFAYKGMTSADEGSKLNSALMFDVMRASGWDVVYLPNPLPDLKGQTQYYIDFAFSTLYSLALPFETGFGPGTMTSLPIQDAEHALEFNNTPFTNFEEGQPFTNNDCDGFAAHFGGGTNWAYSGGIQTYRAAKFRLPKLKQAETDYVGIGIASDNTTQNYSLDVALDSIAVFAY